MGLRFGWFGSCLYLIVHRSPAPPPPQPVKINNRYANPWLFRHHTYITVYVAYFCSFGIVLLAPTDIALTIIGRKENSVTLIEETR